VAVIAVVLMEAPAAAVAGQPVAVVLVEILRRVLAEVAGLAVMTGILAFSMVGVGVVEVRPLVEGVRGVVTEAVPVTAAAIRPAARATRRLPVVEELRVVLLDKVDRDSAVGFI
jgi:hypothetical protein